MKRIKYGLIFIFILSVLFVSCGKNLDDIQTIADNGVDKATEEAETVTGAPEEKETKDSGKADDTVSEEKTEGSGAKISAVSENTTYPDKKYADNIDTEIEAASTGNYIRTRATDKKSGDLIDTSIFMNKGNIVKIITEDYGSEGRLVTDYYYDGDKVAFIRQNKTDIYGIDSSSKEADLSDKEADYTKGMLEQAAAVLKEARSNKGLTLLYGYVGDEQGGVLKNVTVKIRNVAGTYNMEAVTDDDGYYFFNVPQKEDTYNISYTYDTWIVSSLNDVHIIPGMPEYSLGRVYVAPEGHVVHETDVYLLNANAKPPVSLKNGEYAAVLTSDDPAMNMRFVNTDDQDDENGTQIKIDTSKSKNGFALFVEDENYLSKDDMAGNIGRTYMTVTIYDKDGIVAAFREPSGRLGTLWKVCTIKSNGDISISGIMYTDSKGWIK